MNRTCGLLAVLLLLAGAVAVPVAPVGADVPDARLVISEVSVAPEEPTPGNTTTVEFTVENSAGSATGVAVDRVALRERSDSADVHAEATGLGALSVGDSVTLELASAFEDAGVHDLELVVEATDEDGDLVEVTRPVTVVVGGVDAAGVSILNVMLMSTVERRQEIGVLRAVGVSRRDVLRTMLVEAALLGVVGAAGGVLLTALLVAGLYLVTPIDLWIALHPMNAVYLVAAFGFGVLVSVASGLYPAWKAATERPVDALRN